MSQVSAEGVTFEWPQRDADALFASMERARRELNIPMGTAIKKAMNSVARSLGTSTAVAPKYRKYRLVKETAKQVRAKGGRKLYEVTSDRRGKTFFVRAASIRDLKKDPRVIILRAGLAKKSWHWAAAKFGAAGAAGRGITQSAKSEAPKLVSTDGRFRGDDPFAKITNRVSYMGEALQGGAQSVDTAMSRAARAMEHQVDNLLQKKMKAS